MGFGTALAFMIAAVAAAGALLYTGHLLTPASAEPPAETDVTAVPPEAPESASATDANPASPPPATPSPSPATDPPVEALAAETPSEAPPTPGEVRPAPRGTRVALVVDDLGRSLDDVTALAALPAPVTYAVLPFETLTPQVVAEVKRRGGELVLHLPMEAQGGANPGPGALTVAMDDADLDRRTRAALDAVPGAVGVNNHMGSLLSADRRSMTTVLGVVGERGLYFLDSRTSADSVAFRLASSLGVPSAERQVFLDRQIDRRAIRAEFRRLLEVARERGAAIAIGHPHPETLEILAEEVPRAVEMGYEFVPVSHLVTRSSIPAR